MSHKFIFIGGVHRSGTSLIYKILSSHSEISGFSNTGVPEDEGQHLQTLYKPAHKFGGPGHFCFSENSYMDENHYLVNKENSNILFNEWKSYWDIDKKYLIEKSPPNIIRTRFFQALFPDSYFIIVLRHPIAVAYATKKWSKKSSISKLINHTLICYEKFYSDIQSLKNIHIIYYENFVDNPKKVLDEITTKLNIGPIETKQMVYRNINKKYFDKYINDKNNIFKYYFSSLRNISTLYEVRMNQLGYSTTDLKKAGF